MKFGMANGNDKDERGPKSPLYPNETVSTAMDQRAPSWMYGESELLPLAGAMAATILD